MQSPGWQSPWLSPPFSDIVPHFPQSQLTYGKADFINLQRRTEQEKASTKDFAIQGFASDLLATVDILTTALKHVNQPIPLAVRELALRKVRHDIRKRRRKRADIDRTLSSLT
jgi:hypothetical protein